MKENEEWRDVLGYEGFYQVSNLGRVRSLPRVDKRRRPWPGQILKPYMTGKAGAQYPTVSISDKNHKVHRLVALAFLPIVAGKDHINHKDGNRANNEPSNLEWCTNQENSIHARRVLKRLNPPRQRYWKGGGHAGKLGELHHSSKPIIATLPSGEVRYFSAAAEAARSLGLMACSVVRAANGVYSSTRKHKFHWATAAIAE